MNEDYFIIELAHLPKAQRAMRGQFITYVLLVDQVLEELSEGIAGDDEDYMSPLATNKITYSLILGLMGDDPNYRDAILPTAAFGPEMVIAAHLGTTPPPDTEEELWWPEDLPLPTKLHGFSLTDKIYTRDRNRDAAVVKSVLDGSNVRQPNSLRLQALVSFLMIAMELAPESVGDDLATQLGMAMWHDGYIEPGLEAMRALLNLGYEGTRSAWLADEYEKAHPDGPPWLQIQKMRERY